jgi:hypothetical protein
MVTKYNLKILVNKTKTMAMKGSQRSIMWPQGYSVCWQMKIIKT